MPELRIQHLCQALLQMGHLLLDAVQGHSVRGDDKQYREFAQNIRQLGERLGRHPSPLEVLEISSTAVETLESYNEKTSAYFQEQIQECRALLGLLTAAIPNLTACSRRTALRFQEIERRVQTASSPNELRAIREQLQECLAEVSGPKRETAPGAPPVGPRRAAPGSYAVVFIVDRIEAITARHGEAVRNQVLGGLNQYLRQKLPPPDRLLRWRGASFVAFLQKRGTIEDVREEMTSFVTFLPENYVEIGKRSVILPLSLRWNVWPMYEFPSLEDLFSAIDAFMDRPGRS